MSRTSSLNEKVIPTTEVKTVKNAGMISSASKTNSAYNFMNTERKNLQVPSPLKQAKGKLFADDKSSATLKTESTNHSNGTASKGSSEKSKDESPDSLFSNVFLSPTSRSRKRSVKRCQMNYTDIMNTRWLNQLKKKVPIFDVEDANLQRAIKADQRR